MLICKKKAKAKQKIKAYFVERVLGEACFLQQPIVILVDDVWEQLRGMQLR